MIRSMLAAVVEKRWLKADATLEYWQGVLMTVSYRGQSLDFIGLDGDSVVLGKYNTLDEIATVSPLDKDYQDVCHQIMTQKPSIVNYREM
jgi:hypothetical protein